MATNHKGDNITKTISLPKDMFADLQDRLASLKIGNLSRYVQDLIREDLKRRGALAVTESIPLLGESARKRKTSYLSHQPASMLAENCLDAAPVKKLKTRKAA
jgi:hypothetical protein